MNKSVVVSAGRDEIELRWARDGVYVHRCRPDQPAFLDITAAAWLHHELGEWLLERARSDERWRDAIGSTMTAMCRRMPLFKFVGSPSREHISGARAAILSFSNALIHAGEGRRLEVWLQFLLKELRTYGNSSEHAAATASAEIEQAKQAWEAEAVVHDATAKTPPPTEAVPAAPVEKLEEIREIEQIRALVDLEEEFGPIVPGGAQGGVVAKHRRAAAAAEAAKKTPLQDLFAHVEAAEQALARVGRAREALEKAWDIVTWVANHVPAPSDWACAECNLKPGFKCAVHQARALTAKEK
jgi:hypothetical protein